MGKERGDHQLFKIIEVLQGVVEIDASEPTFDKLWKIWLDSVAGLLILEKKANSLQESVCLLLVKRRLEKASISDISKQ